MAKVTLIDPITSTGIEYTSHVNLTLGLGNPNYSDLLLTVNDKKYYASSIVLAFTSKFFKESIETAVAQNSFQEDRIFIIVDLSSLETPISNELFEKFLKVLYGGTVHITSVELNAFMSLLLTLEVEKSIVRNYFNLLLRYIQSYGEKNISMLICIAYQAQYYQNDELYKVVIKKLISVVADINLILDSPCATDVIIYDYALGFVNSSMKPNIIEALDIWALEGNSDLVKTIDDREEYRVDLVDKIKEKYNSSKKHEKHKASKLTVRPREEEIIVTTQKPFAPIRRRQTEVTEIIE